ncbi:DUF7093 family protein [Halobacteriaceae archaeon SHR40]|uniref:DUF7093 family protein n=1 Tax=Halovenus amylolytica TaxID=2500550 RepID=UPI000FE42322
MSFKCSVFGHAFGDAEIERNREEDGSEVVTTIRETQTCKRCGEERIVSENKEVTTLETAADIVADDLAEESDEEPVASEPPAEPAETQSDSQPDAEILDAETNTAPAAGPEGGASQTPATATDEPTTDEGPTVSDQQTAGEAGFADAESEPKTDPETDDGVILDDEEDEADDRSPGEWPEEPGDNEDDWQPETEIDPTPDEPDVEPTGSAVSVPDGEFHCPECEFRTPVEESSLRAGDFCPECHRGSLEHVSE